MSTTRHWQNRVIARSLERAAASPADRRTAESISRRALPPATKIVFATLELMKELESSSFTVQDVLDRAGTSLQTFYRHFSGKDELLLAVLEERVVESTEHYVRLSASVGDPVERLEQIVKGPFTNSLQPAIGRLITREHHRLLENFADEVRLADLPFMLAVSERIQAAQATGRFPGIIARSTAELINDFVRVRYHIFFLGLVRHTANEEAELIWEFCLAGLTRNETARMSPGFDVDGALTV